MIYIALDVVVDRNVTEAIILYSHFCMLHQSWEVCGSIILVLVVVRKLCKLTSSCI